MRIAVVSPYDPFPSQADPGAHVGGVERMLAEVSVRMARRGHQVTVVCSSDHDGPGTEPAGLHVIRVPRRGTMFRAPITRLAPHIPDVDVIHVPATYPFTTPSVLRHASRTGTPCVLDFHFEPAPGGPVGQVAARAYRAIGPRSYRLADAVLVRSHGYAASAPSLRNTSPERRHELPNGIDTQRFHARGAPPADAPILFVGRLVPYKGLGVLLRALARLEDPPPLSVVGDGPLRPRLQAEAARLGLDVTFHGHVADDALPGHYRAARFTVLPSVTGQECFGISLIESMACGTPVVASRLPGVADVAALGGPTAPPGDVVALAAALQDALDCPGTQGHALAASIHERFSWEAVTDRLLAVYERLRDPPGPPWVHHAHPRSDAVL